MRPQHKIHLLRKMLGWSQETMGHQLGISQRQYGRWENGESRLSVTMIERICSCWNITTDEFYKMGVEELYELICTKKH